jgi:hypothetical protein
MTRTTAFALVALAAVGCGGGRSILLSPRGDSPQTVPPSGPDGSRDVIREPALPDTGPVQPDAVREELRPLVPDVPPISPDVGPASDLVEVRPQRPDAGPDGLPPPSDARQDLLPPFDLRPDFVPPPTDAAPDLLPPPFDLKPDLLPPPLDLKPDLLPPPLDLKPDLLPVTPDLASPDVRRPAPDGLPPLQICVNGGACFSDCQTTCSSFGTSTCTCTSGVLVCGACQPPNIHVTFTPCPDRASGTVCDSSGLACPVYANGSITGFCACLDLGNGMRWNCF